MSMNRRTFLGTAAGVAAAGLLERVLADPLGLPEALQPAYAAERDPAAHVVHRLTFGPRPGLVEQVQQMGVSEWIEAQLNPETLDDTELESALRQNAPTLWMTPDEIFANGIPENEQRPAFLAELQAGTLARAIYSQRQLYEMMVQFWSDHFSIYMLDGPVVFLKTTDDREVIRPHAMGRFRDLLGASAHSPAMLLYLDNASSSREHPNENYARELMELHTLGVNGGYTEDDVYAVARVLTGWSVGRPRQGENPGTFVFRARMHDDSEQRVLGEVIPAGLGEAAGERVLDLLAEHPSTARFISTKLVRRFVADDPPAHLVDAVAATYMDTGGDIRAMLRTIFDSEDFWNAPPKLKRPWNYVASILRAFNAELSFREPRAFREFMVGMEAMGHIPFLHPTPDGYPDVAEAWADNMLNRWNAALLIIFNGVTGINIDLQAELSAAGVPYEPEPIFNYFADLLLSRPLSEAERSAIWGYVTSGGLPDMTIEEDLYRLAEGIVLLAASPAFQYR